MSDLLLVHGSCHGAWCWDRVIPELARLGHNARAIDLPGRGGGAVTLDDQAQAILGALTASTLVVGHSAGGFAITAAAERDAARIAGLVYLCAYLPVSGQSLADMRRAGPRQPLRAAIRLSEDRHAFSFDPARARDVLYHDCPDAVAAGAIARLCAEPVAPQETPLTLVVSPGLPRDYILCSDDRAIPPEFQAAMASVLPPVRQSLLATSHSPFLSAPLALARSLDRIARSSPTA